MLRPMYTLLILLVITLPLEAGKDTSGLPETTVTVSAAEIAGTADELKFRMIGFSGTSFELTYHPRKSTLTGYLVDPSAKREHTRQVLAPGTLLGDFQEDFEAALETVLLVTPSPEECEACAFQGIADGDFPTITVGNEIYSTYPGSCQTIRYTDAGDEKREAFFSVLIRIARELAPRASP